jgi:hypothetical protein
MRADQQATRFMALVTLTLSLIPWMPVRSQPSTAVVDAPGLSRVLRTFAPGDAMRVGLQDSTEIEGRMQLLQGSRLLLHTVDTQTVDVALPDIVRVDERGVSKARGTFLGALIVGAAGAVTGLFVGILSMDNPDNSDLIASSAALGVLGIGLGATVGRNLDPGRPSGWRQCYPVPGSRDGQWDLKP